MILAPNVSPRVPITLVVAVTRLIRSRESTKASPKSSSSESLQALSDGSLLPALQVVVFHLTMLLCGLWTTGCSFSSHDALLCYGVHPEYCTVPLAVVVFHLTMLYSAAAYTVNIVQCRLPLLTSDAMLTKQMLHYVVEDKHQEPKPHVRALIPLMEMKEMGVCKKYGITPDSEIFELLETVSSIKEVKVEEVYWGDPREKLCEAVNHLCL
ncbi:hypothetical protein L6452_30455 [Arctium lappa]|uniref:Uncharacterized protein n=1 Tax=Arctium lappa TaxID=4217 RepID=A0ACB8ZIJ8_ARCLA|nr:hypothetical protein L6452_45212 [Arctium lappa]KAI3697438.1 hypothetical protein L6452_30455 [Arctium lappa]